MKPRPPTLRDSRRYLLVAVMPAYSEMDAKQVYYAILEAMSSLWGDALAAEAQMGVISCEDGYAIIRCRRGRERRVETALATITKVNGHHIALHATMTSGTIRSLKEKMKGLSLPGEAVSISFEGRMVSAYCYSSQKIDLFPKGIKNGETFYFTHEEMEES